MLVPDTAERVRSTAVPSASASLRLVAPCRTSVPDIQHSVCLARHAASETNRISRLEQTSLRLHPL
eukprot:1777160-Rhodomonas_salina.2